MRRKIQGREVSRRVNVLRIAMDLCKKDIRPANCQILAFILDNMRSQLLNNFLWGKLFISPRLSKLILRWLKGSERLISFLLRRLEPILEIDYSHQHRSEVSLLTYPIATRVL